MALAFRLSGAFVWPPSADKPATDDPPTRDGTVEIHFVEAQAPKTEVRAVLRWTAGRVIPVGEPAVAEKNVYELPEASQWFDANGGDGSDISVWITDDAKNVKGPKIAFRGAFLFEQYSPDLDGGLPRRPLRWPLLRQCRYEATARNVYSELIVGQGSKAAHDESPAFRFNLQLPTPFPQTDASAAALNPAVFPFSAVYSPTKSTMESAIILTTLVGGRVETSGATSF